MGNEIDAGFEEVEDDGKYDVNNSTHTTKTLSDGSVVHINKTTISDTDEDGNSFFFHRSVIHNVGGGDFDSYYGEQFPDQEEEEAEATVADSGVDDGLMG